MGFLAHGFLLVNLSVSHDALFDFYEMRADHQHQIELGRILEPLYREATGSVLLMPWTVGLAAFFWLGIAVFLVCKLFELTERTQIILTAGIMTVNISVTAVGAAYTPWLAVDMLALLLSVAGVYFWRRYTDGHQIKWLLSGMLAVIGSLCLYQCYLAVTVVLMIFLSMQGLFAEKGAAKVFKDGCAGIGMIAAGGAIYYFLMKLACRMTGVSLLTGDYDSVTNLWDNQEPVARRLFACIKEGMTHFFAKDENIYPYPLIWTVNLLLLCVCLVLVFWLVRAKRTELKMADWLLLALLTAALPFAAYLMRLLNTSVHDLMCYAVWLLYLLPLLLHKWLVGAKYGGVAAQEREAAQEQATDQRRTAETGRAVKRSYGVLTALLAIILFSYIQTDNAVYVKKQVESEATLSLMTEVMAQVDQTEGYVAGETEIAFVGDIWKVLRELPGTERIKGVSGCNKTTAITYYKTYQAYFDHVLLRDVNVVQNEEMMERPEVVQMPGYPQQGYVQMVDRTVVVKWN